MILLLLIMIIIKTPGLGRMLGRERMLPRRHTDPRMQQRQEDEMLEREHLRITRAGRRKMAAGHGPVCARGPGARARAAG